MKGGYLFTIIFMLVLSLVLAFGLALANQYYQPAIQRNQAQAEKKAVLEVFGLDTTGAAAELDARFAEKIRGVDLQGRKIYVFNEDEVIKGAAIPFSGPGLWGTIRGYLAVSADNTLLGLVFTDQNETPGLGGRIDEPAFKEQFRTLKINTGKPLAFGMEGGAVLDAIAGATSSSRAVLQIVNRLIADELPGLEVVP